MVLKPIQQKKTSSKSTDQSVSRIRTLITITPKSSSFLNRPKYTYPQGFIYGNAINTRNQIRGPVTPDVLPSPPCPKCYTPRKSHWHPSTTSSADPVISQISMVYPVPWSRLHSSSPSKEILNSSLSHGLSTQEISSKSINRLVDARLFASMCTNK